MTQLYRFNSVSEYNELNNHETHHPLVSVIDFSKAEPRNWDGHKSIKLHFGLYTIFLKDVKCGDLKYGRNYYDYQEGTLVFVNPGQVLELEVTGEYYQPFGHALVFHPDLLAGTSLASSIQDYHFFSYETSEALHVSERERQIILDCFSKIEFELGFKYPQHFTRLFKERVGSTPTEYKSLN